ncbi:MAG TPA: hypothetical protein VG247_01700 [Pseudonocardiaceae bacterium]|jgi:hypothetical protein|nr:hypothetical protein [Pseudonocardiaceae bacterium]
MAYRECLLIVETQEATMPSAQHETSGFVLTDAGMLALWDTAWFSDVVDYDIWELRLLDDEEMNGHITAGAIVPIKVGNAGGGWSVLVRVGTAEEPAELTGREARYEIAAGGPYLLISTGDVRFSGLEAIGVDLLDTALAPSLPSGRYMVRVHRLDWAAEPDSRKDSGEPMPHALTDFVVLVSPERGRPDYQMCIEPFPPLPQH